MLILAVASPYTRSTAKIVAPYVKEGQYIVNVGKGIEEESLKTLCEVTKEEIPQAVVAVLSGPSHAEEVGRGIPTTCVIGTANKKDAEYLQNMFMSNVFRVYISPDVLGICIGMQLMCRHSEEGDTDCLGIFDVGVKRFVPTEHQFKIPHMGWNSIGNLKSPLFKGIDNGEFVYFIHSYYIPDNDNSIAECNYIHSFCASLNKDNFYATQFHPEKSGSVGERIIENFLSISRI